MCGTLDTTGTCVLPLPLVPFTAASGAEGEPGADAEEAEGVLFSACTCAPGAETRAAASDAVCTTCDAGGEADAAT